MWAYRYGESRGDAGVEHGVALSPQLVQCGVQIDGVPQGDAVDDQESYQQKVQQRLERQRGGQRCAGRGNVPDHDGRLRQDGRLLRVRQEPAARR